MSMNSDGFWVPLVNDKRCIDCGICQKICYRFITPSMNTTKLTDQLVFGVYSSDSKVHFNTTSGGFAYELSRWGIENNYKVMGVKYDYEKDCAKTVIIDSLQELDLLRGSKYLQSDTSEALEQLLKDAKENPMQKYICIGTPCQIFGLRQLIQTKQLTNDFVFVDLFCHGVPSYNVWKPYIIDKRKYLGNIKEVNFRYKGNGWHQYTILIKGSNGNYCEYAYKDLFYRYFFDNIALNASCFCCDLRKSYTASDLRLGDFWGKHYNNREDGISAVLVASNKGLSILDDLKSKGNIIVDKEWQMDSCLEAQSTKNYRGMELRNVVLQKLASGMNVVDVQKFYFRNLPFRRRCLSIVKRMIVVLPNSLLLLIRRLFHAICFINLGVICEYFN